MYADVANWQIIAWSMATGAAIAVGALSGWVVVALGVVYVYMEGQRIRPLELSYTLTTERLNMLRQATASVEAARRAPQERRTREHSMHTGDPDDERQRLRVAPYREEVSHSRANNLPIIDFAAELNDDSSEGCVVHTSGLGA